MAEEIKDEHPLARQNSIERAIQLEGPKDPDKFKMPDGRSLTEVRKANQETEDVEYQDEVKMLAERTREQSIGEYSKGEKLVMTKAGNLIDVTEPTVSEDTVTMATSRTTMEEISEGVVQPLRERGGGTASAPAGETATSSGQSLGSSTSAPPSGSTTAAPSAPAGSPGK